MKQWKNKLLSATTKEVLLNAVTMALPTYAMSCFKLLAKLCKELTFMMSNFWWGERTIEDRKSTGVHEKLTQEKKRGGLGFRDLQNFNRAVLGKQVWRLMTNPNSLVTKILIVKYYSKKSILKCRVPYNASWIWQSLIEVK